MESMVKKAIEERLDRLSPERLQEVLAFVNSRCGEKSAPGSPVRLLGFAGCIDPADLDLMLQAVEDGCERIDSREW
jgi:hypothetical protein